MSAANEGIAYAERVVDYCTCEKYVKVKTIGYSRCAREKAAEALRRRVPRPAVGKRK